MSGEFVGKVEDFEPPKPHVCETPARINYATGARVPKADEGQVWRCECGKAYRCVIEYDQREHDSWTTWKRYERADAVEPPHSRACGIKRHDHGPDCHSNCPTCGGRSRDRPAGVEDPRSPNPDTPSVR